MRILNFILVAILATAQPPAGRAALAADASVSRLPTVAGGAPCANTATQTPDKCAAIIAAVTGERIIYPTIQWTEIDSRNIHRREERILQRQFLAGSAAAESQRDLPDLSAGFDRLTEYVRTTTRPHYTVLGLYDGVNGALRIVVSKVERGRQLETKADGTKGFNEYKIRLSQGIIGPRHFDYMKASRVLLPTAKKRADKDVAGINPFAQFDRGDASELFQNIDFAAALVAVSKAQALVGAPVAFMAMAKPRVSTYTTKSGGLFRKTITRYATGHLKPEWMMLVANSAGGHILNDGVTSLFCAVDTSENADGAGGNCPQSSVVSAESFALRMEGGNIPAAEMRLPGTTTVVSQTKGWSVIGMAFIFAAVFAAGGFLAAGQGLLGVGAAAGGGNLAATAAAAGAASGFSGYLIHSRLFHEAGPGDYLRLAHGKKISGGAFAADAKQFGEISVGSAAHRGFGDKFGRAMHEAFSTRNPEKDALPAVACLWGGAAAKCARDFRGDADDFVIAATGAEMRADLDMKGRSGLNLQKKEGQRRERVAREAREKAEKAAAAEVVAILPDAAVFDGRAASLRRELGGRFWRARENLRENLKRAAGILESHYAQQQKALRGARENNIFAAGCADAGAAVPCGTVNAYQNITAAADIVPPQFWRNPYGGNLMYRINGTVEVGGETYTLSLPETTTITAAHSPVVGVVVAAVPRGTVACRTVPAATGDISFCEYILVLGEAR